MGRIYVPSTPATRGEVEASATPAEPELVEEPGPAPPAKKAAAKKSASSE